MGAKTVELTPFSQQKMIEIDTKILNYRHENCAGVRTFGKFSCPGVGTFSKKLCPTPGKFTSARGVPERIEGSITVVTKFKKV